LNNLEKKTHTHTYIYIYIINKKNMIQK